MYIQEAHILIEQGLQNIGVFAYSDMLPDELDLIIKNEVWNILEEDFNPLEGKQKKTFKNQANIDKYKNLIVKELELPVVSASNGLHMATLPSNYYHLIKDRSVVLYECATCLITSGNIKAEEWYIVKGRDIVYLGVTYKKGQIFKGQASATTFTDTVTTEPVKVLLMKRKSSPNRQIEEEFVDAVNDNALTVTSKDSPISTLAGDAIAVYTKDFFIEKVFISYLRTPKNPYLSFKQYVAGDTLTVGLVYEVINGQIIYDGITYRANPNYEFQAFVPVTGKTTFTGTGIVRLNREGDIDLPRQIAQKVIDKVIIKLASITEQSQQKVVNLSQLSK